MAKVSGVGEIFQDQSTVYFWASGSRGKNDWRDNFRFRRVPLPEDREIRVSKADYDEAERVIAYLEEPNILNEVGSLQRQDRKSLCISGVSKGGAVASIVSLRLALRGFMVHARLFAPKRFGNKKAQKTLLNSATLFVNGITANTFDVVPFLPFWWAKYPLIKWDKRNMWPWMAHMKSVKDAARWRHINKKEVREKRMW